LLGRNESYVNEKNPIPRRTLASKQLSRLEDLLVYVTFYFPFFILECEVENMNDMFI
jgi:hypothetical protein